MTDLEIRAMKIRKEYALKLRRKGELSAEEAMLATVRPGRNLLMASLAAAAEMPCPPLEPPEPSIARLMQENRGDFLSAA